MNERAKGPGEVGYKHDARERVTALLYGAGFERGRVKQKHLDALMVLCERVLDDIPIASDPIPDADAALCAWAGIPVDYEPVAR